MVWSTTEINDESHDQKTDNRNDLNGGKDELGFTIDLYGEDVQADNEDDDKGNPDSNADVVRTLPVLDNDRGGGDFGTESDCRCIPVLLTEVSIVVMERDRLSKNKRGFNLRSTQPRIQEHHRHNERRIGELNLEEGAKWPSHPSTAS